MINLKLKQISALLVKNLKINLRNKIDVLREFVFPLLVLGLIIVKKDVSFFPQILLPFYFPLTYIGLLRKIFIDLVLEKSQKYKETLKIMGLQQISFTISWLLTFYIIGILIEIVMSITLYYGEIINETRNISKLLLSYFLYMIAAIHMCFCITSLFSDPKKSIKVGSVILSICCFIYFLCTYASLPLGLVYFLSLIPQANASLTLMTLQPSKNEYNIGYYEDIGLGIQAFNVVFYFLLYLYLEEVVQNEYGISKSKCFCFQGLFQSAKKKKAKAIHPPQIDLISQNMLNEIQNNSVSAIKISNLCKHFPPDVKAVDDISLEIPKGELFCLLGHNGAGKTTTINLLTGLIKANSGQIEINNLDFQSHLDQIRRSIGYCPQSDVLYEYLTVKEHLNLIESIKGYPKNSSLALVPSLDLQQYLNEYTKTLSLGTKRKLSLLMALICDSELIFLDEPTSGMDPASRRKVWKLLLEIKEQKKSIIWTTHHLEEAEKIADRIGIMSKGKLEIIGTVNEIKNKFGMGHIFTISIKKNEKNIKKLDSFKTEIVKIVEKFKPMAKFIESQVNEEFFKFLIPKGDTNSNMIREIEEKYPFLQMSFENNSLEDVFINIGMQQNPHLQNIWRDLAEEELEMAPMEANISNKVSNLFMKQVWAIFLHRLLLFIHDFSSSIVIFLGHLFYLIIMIIICKYLILDYPDISINEKTQYTAKLVLSAYILLSTLFLGHHVIERELYVKYVMIVMGCKISAYWIGNFFFDLIIFLISFLILTITVYSGELWIFTDIYGSFTFVILMFGLSLILFAYICSFIFRSYHSAAHFFPLIVFLTFAIPYLLIYLFEEGIFQNEHEKSLLSRQILQGIFLMFTPLYAAERGVSLLRGENNEQYIIKEPNLVAVVLFFQAILWLIFLLLLENKYLFYFAKRKSLSKQKELIVGENTQGLLNQILDENKIPNNDIPMIDLESLQQEKEKLLKYSPEDLLKIYNLRKKYQNNETLKGIDFCVSENQIFALLGPNGAGKTTTFNILTSLIEKDSGLVLLENQIANLCDFYNIFQKVNVGLCPQFNGLWDNLTIKEHIFIYGLLKGLDSAAIKKEYEDIVKELDLLSLTKRKSKDLSGGNKRKLCAALAILGFPKIIFMDEPSTGIDPLSKRLLWNLLKKRFRMKKCCVVLTTHSMNEAEFLGTKIGILIKGQFLSINSLQTMKAKYTEGYSVVLKIKEEKNKEFIFKELKENFEYAQEENNKKTEVNLLLKEKEGAKFYEIVEFLENNLKGVIDDFAISYCSLEEIFLRMVKDQENLENKEE